MNLPKKIILDEFLCFDNPDEDEVDFCSTTIICPVCGDLCKVKIARYDLKIHPEDNLITFQEELPCGHTFIFEITPTGNVKSLKRAYHVSVILIKLDTEYFRSIEQRIQEQHDALIREGKHNQAFQKLKELQLLREEIEKKE